MRQLVSCSVLLTVALWSAAPAAAAGTAGLLRDINQSDPPSLGGYGISGRLQPAGDRVVFTASSPGSGVEPWGSDGSAQGTELLREVLPGPDSARIWMLGTVRGVAVFLTDDYSSRSFGLWRSDGTREGTVLVDPSLSPCFDAPKSAVQGDSLFFTARRDTGCLLWRTNGSAVEEVRGPGSAPIAEAQELTPAGNRLYFIADASLWAVDANSSSARNLGTFASLNGPRDLTVVGARVFFIAPGDTGQDEELWVSDGTAAGTRQVSRFFEPLPFGSEFTGALLEGLDGVLYFVAGDGTGLDLWRSDGTTAGTRRVTDFIATNPFIESFDETHLVRLGGRLIFPAREEGDFAPQLWESGGTPATTRRLTGCPGGGCPRVSGPLVQIGSRAVFASYSDASGTDLWVTDGTGAGTRRLGDLCAGFCDNAPAFFPLLGKIFYIGYDAQGYGLWQTDGTQRGTVRLTPLGFRPFDFEAPFAPVAAGGRIFFAADPEDRGAQLWTSDGTPEGTGLVTLIDPGAASSSPVDITPFQGGVIFGATDEDQVGLWRSDGTTAGTQLIQATASSAGDTNEYPRPVVSGGLAYFLKSEQPYGEGDLWRTDGTEAGTFRLTPEEIRRPGAVSPFGDGVVFLVSNDDTYEVTLWASDGSVAGTRPLFVLPTGPLRMWASSTRIYFVGYHEDYEQLWISDGTEAGTHPITDFHQSVFYDLVELKEVGSTLFFTVQGQLWKSDGTLAGTAPVLPANAVEGRAPSDLTAFQGQLYFMAYTGQGEVGRGLWRSDGTAAGTVLVRPVGPVVSESSGQPLPAWLTVVGDHLYFAASDGAEHGMELWKSDGTTAGTVMVDDILPGEGSSQPSELVAAQGRLFFVAHDGTSGFELWESQGTAATTRRVQDILPGAGGSNPHDLTVSGARLFFAANDGVHGEEPWVLPLTGGGCTASPASGNTLCLGGRFQVEATWRDFAGNRGEGTAVALTADTGYFWFFEPSNVEVILKVLDGRGTNDHFWVFYGALSSVEYTLTVTDTETGAVRRYINPPGRLASVADTEAFGPRGANLANPVTVGPSPVESGSAPDLENALTSLRWTGAPAGTCAPSSTRLCLNDGRFAVEARWKDFQGNTGVGRAVPLAGGDTGYFWFFDDDNVEVVLKVLDGRPLNGKFWVFYGALSSVEYTLTVTDTVTGAGKTYTNASGRLSSVADTGAF